MNTYYDISRFMDGKDFNPPVYDGEWWVVHRTLFKSDAIDWINKHPGWIYRIYRVEVTQTLVLDTTAPS